MDEAKQVRIENLRLEYQLTQDMAIHYDTLNWSIGAILIAGVFGMIVLSKDSIEIYWIIAILSFFVLLIWRLFYIRHKRIQIIKFIRLQTIENYLELNQHILVQKLDNGGEIFEFKAASCADALVCLMPTIILAYWSYRTHTREQTLLILLGGFILFIIVVNITKHLDKKSKDGFMKAAGVKKDGTLV